MRVFVSVVVAPPLISLGSVRSFSTSRITRTLYVSSTSVRIMFENLSNASTYAVATPRTPRACRVTIFTRSLRSRASLSTRSGPSRACFELASTSHTRSRCANFSPCFVNFSARCFALACAANDVASRVARAPPRPSPPSPSSAPDGSNRRHCRTVSNARARGRGGTAPESFRKANAGSKSSE